MLEYVVCMMDYGMGSREEDERRSTGSGQAAAKAHILARASAGTCPHPTQQNATINTNTQYYAARRPCRRTRAGAHILHMCHVYMH